MKYAGARRVLHDDLPKHVIQTVCAVKRPYLSAARDFRWVASLLPSWRAEFIRLSGKLDHIGKLAPEPIHVKAYADGARIATRCAQNLGWLTRATLDDGDPTMVEGFRVRIVLQATMRDIVSLDRVVRLKRRGSRCVRQGL